MSLDGNFIGMNFTMSLEDNPTTDLPVRTAKAARAAKANTATGELFIVVFVKRFVRYWSKVYYCS
jgi:hypothetical protein